MPAPILNHHIQGTPIVWGPSGGTGVTKIISVNALANTAAQMGEFVDLGANLPPWIEVHLYVETGTAPSAGGTADLYLGWSYDGVRFPAKVTGLDASYTRGTSDANLRQFGGRFYSLIATNDADTRLYQGPWFVQPISRYVAPVLVNNFSVAFRNRSPASGNLTRIEIIPRIPRFAAA
jgi:hypothetical protein